MNKVTRRQALISVAALGGAYGLGLATPKLIEFVDGAPLRRAVNSILLAKPIPTGLDLGGPVAKLVEAGVIDPGKFLETLKRRGPIPGWVTLVLEGQEQELVLSVENAPYNLNLLWPLGLATKAAFNDESPIGGVDLPNFASTGGWTLGRQGNGAAYFNKVETLYLSPEQSSLAHGIAKNIFRPCCGNSAFFQDCNHGSAMLGLIELAASSGRDSTDILKLAKVANGLWYPKKYVETALFFDRVIGASWGNVGADMVLSSKYSSIEGWRKNVHAALVVRGYIVRPRQGGGGESGCAV